MAAKKPPVLSPGRKMVAGILAQMLEFGVVPDAKEEALLDTARQIVDRLDALERSIARDGELLTNAAGVIRVHPAVSEHRNLAATLPKVLSGIVIGDSSAGKNPVKVAAAQTRWRAHNIAKAEQAAR